MCVTSILQGPRTLQIAAGTGACLDGEGMLRIDAAESAHAGADHPQSAAGGGGAEQGGHRPRSRYRRTHPRNPRPSSPGGEGFLMVVASSRLEESPTPGRGMPVHHSLPPRPRAAPQGLAHPAGSTSARIGPPLRAVWSLDATAMPHGPISGSVLTAAIPQPAQGRPPRNLF